VNSIQGNQIRTLSVFQALAKGLRSGEEKWSADVYTPLLDKKEPVEVGQAAREARERGALLSELELKVAYEAVQDWMPRLIMMDGSLSHFMFDHAKQWATLAQCVHQHDVLIVGVIEEIQSFRLVQELFPD